MRKMIFTLFLSVVFSVYIFAQESEKAIGKLEYDIMRAYVPTEPSQAPTTGTKNYFTQKHSIYFGKTASLDIEHIGRQDPIVLLKSGETTRSISEKEIEDDPDLKEALGNRTKQTLPEISNISYKLYNDSIRISVKNHNDLSVIQTDTLPQIDWKLTDEEKKINGYPVHKATARFRGRSYTAWYTKAIPIPAGPWKLHGLPGLIVEAYDDTGEVKMVMTQLEVPVRQEIQIAEPVPQGKIVSEQEFAETQRKKNQEAQRMRRASGAAGTPPSATETIRYRVASLEK